MCLLKVRVSSRLNQFIFPIIFFTFAYLFLYMRDGACVEVKEQVVGVLSLSVDSWD